MFNRIIRSLDPILLIGLLISISIGLVMVSTGHDTPISLTIGLLSTIITLLIDVIARIEKTEKSFLNAAGLSRTLSDESIGKTLQEIADNYIEIKKYKFGHYFNIAEAALDQCQTKLRELANGSVLVMAKSGQDYGVQGIMDARQDMKVIHIGNMGFWSSDFGRKYLELNRLATKRGVQITRIFALTTEEIQDSIDVLIEQEKAGIRAFVVRPEKVEHEYIIYDNQFLVDLDVDTTRDYRVERIVLDPTQVKKRIEEFQFLITRYATSARETISTYQKRAG